MNGEMKSVCLLITINTFIDQILIFMGIDLDFDEKTLNSNINLTLVHKVHFCD